MACKSGLFLDSLEACGKYFNQTFLFVITTEFWYFTSLIVYPNLLNFLAMILQCITQKYTQPTLSSELKRVVEQSKEMFKYAFVKTVPIFQMAAKAVYRMMLISLGHTSTILEHH